MSGLKKVKIKASIMATESNCSHCGKKYHTVAQYWIKHPDKRNQRRKNAQSNKPSKVMTKESKNSLL
jgi:ribosome-binding protein aMBF1 (putative translation factor)